MADLVIRGMEMPKDQPVLVFIWPDGRVFPRGLYKSNEWDEVKAIPLPEGHGKCIDADALMPDFVKARWAFFSDGDTFLQLLKHAPTVVPAEGGDNNEHV